ncbi:SseB family protein [Modestobacter sp. Leaf380]|uniref:SseB family protein n=1 Tax=Modestobacter sp. Leaf380 TaxID=1736356 RepID=UPI0009E90356|nr:SseB family protein [Modestobacter sp. Leaf380]
MPEPTLEEQLGELWAAGDRVSCLQLLRGAELALPVTEAAAEGREPAAWATVAGPDRTWVLAFTSVEAMVEATGGAATRARVLGFAELAAGWPDPRWGLAVDPGRRTPFSLESGALARLAAPTLVEDRLREPDTLPTLVQRPISADELFELINTRSGRVSGYVHNLHDAAHLSTPEALLGAVGLRDRAGELLAEDGTLLVLRWPVLEPEAHRTPLGGTDDERRDAVGGWVVEEEPFTGLGFTADVDSLVREYRVHGLLLPHAAEVWEMAPDGTERRRAQWDGDAGRWLWAVRVDPDAAPEGPTPDGPAPDGTAPEGGAP